MPGGRLSLRLALGWAVGSAVMSLVGTTSAIFLLRYLIDFVGLGAFLAGIILAMTKLFDILLSPMVGYASDRTKSRWGRRRPFMAVGCAIAAVGIILAFHVPSAFTATGAMIYSIFALFVVSLGYAAFGTPYLAMPVELSHDPRERAKLISFRVYVLGFAQILGGAVSPFLLQSFGSNRDAYGDMAVAIGLVIAAVGLICVWATAGGETVATDPPSSESFWRMLPTIRRSRLFLCVILVKFTFLTGSAVHMVSVSFYVRYVLQAEGELLGAFLIAHSAGMILSQPVWLMLARRVGKPTGFLFAAALYAGISLAWTGIGPTMPWTIIVALSVLNGCGAGGILMNSEALLPDAMEEDFVLNGVRREGTLAAIYNFVDRIAQSFGMMLGGLVLAAFGYVAPTPEHPITQASRQAVLGAFGYVPAILVAASCIWLILFGLVSAGARRAELSISTSGR